MPSTQKVRGPADSMYAMVSAEPVTMAPANTSAASILIVDDENSARMGLVELLRDEGYAARGAADGFKALGKLDGWEPDLVITDVHMPGMTGIELMAKLRILLPRTAIIVMTAYSSVEMAVEAMRQGADDYLTKPIRFDELLIVTKRILAQRDLVQENERLRSALQTPAEDAGWIGSSKASRSILALLRQVAPSDTTVLMIGEGGTGKQLAARAMHRWSGRAEGPFVSMHCSAVPGDFVATELFGDSSATDDEHGGALKRADGGTLFLDEVAHLPQTAQLQLLEFLERGEFTPEGAHEAIAADVRIVAATDRDLRAEVDAGRFREDLYYRLNVIALRIPPLRQRREDVPMLAMHALRRSATKNQKTIRGFSERALHALQGYRWPGNVRELENVVEHAVVMCHSHEITPRDLPKEVLSGGTGGDESPTVPGASMAELERYAILQTLEHVGGSTKRAAEILGISPRTIQYRLNQYSENDG